MNVTVTGILSYPNLHRAVALESFPNNPPMFRCTVLLKKDSNDLRRIENLIEQVKRDKWNDNVPSSFALKCLLYDVEDPTTQGYVSFKALSSQDNKPRVIDKKGEEIIMSDQCTPGIKCMMSASLYAYSKAGNGVSAGINGVKILGVMGELGPLGRGRLSDEEMFGGNHFNSNILLSEPAVIKKYTMTSEAKKLGWHNRSDVKGDWDNDQLLLVNGYMTADIFTEQQGFY